MNKDNIHILTSAEAFGYGPCSKLVTVVRALRKEFPNAKVDFLGEGAALTFAIQNDEIFHFVKEYNGAYPDARDVDIVISVMNPYMVIWGWFNRKRSIYVDSLYWFWKFENDSMERLEKVVEELTNAQSIDEVWSLTKDISSHSLHYIAHRLSSISCSQIFYEGNRAADKFRSKIQTIPVNPIVDVSFRRNTNKDTILISLGGLLSPLNREREALSYVKLILKITEDFISEASKKYNIVLATNPEVARLIDAVPKNVTVTSLSQKEILEIMNRSALVLTPAGLTTIYECLSYGAPIFVLPELHDGHYPNFLGLSSGKKKKIDVVHDTFPNALINPLLKVVPNQNPDVEIQRIQAIIKQLNITNKPTIHVLKKKVNALLDIIFDQEKLKKLAQRQSSFVYKNHRTGKEVIDVVNNEIKNGDKVPPVQKKHLVGIISSAVPVNDKGIKNQFRKLGNSLAGYNINIATGAAIGLSHTVGLGAKEGGSRLFGFSPSSNALIHSRQSDNAPISDFDVMHFNGSGFTARSLEFINSADAIIMVAGRMGTLSEFTIAFEEGAPVFVLKGYGGISDRIEEIIKFAKKDGLQPPSVVSDTGDLLEKLVSRLNLTYYK